MAGPERIELPPPGSKPGMISISPKADVKEPCCDLTKSTGQGRVVDGAGSGNRTRNLSLARICVTTSTMPAYVVIIYSNSIQVNQNQALHLSLRAVRFPRSPPVTYLDDD